MWMNVNVNLRIAISLRKTFHNFIHPLQTVRRTRSVSSRPDDPRGTGKPGEGN